MLDLIRRCFPEQAASAEWSAKLNEIFPVPAATLASDAEQYRAIQAQSDALLQLRDTTPA
jgi:malate dehydrogenase (quinone)